MNVRERPVSTLTRHHLRRLKDYWRGASWPCLDSLELDLLAAGLVQRELRIAGGLECITVTPEGVAALGAQLLRNRQALHAHEDLITGLADWLCNTQGRICFTGLSLRAQLDGRWRIARPDVYSLRNSPMEEYHWPAVHEIKVRRADLLGELRRPDKTAAYAELAGEVWFVFPSGIARAEEIPEGLGVIQHALAGGFTVMRAAARRRRILKVSEWLELAKATPVRASDEGMQAPLTSASDG